MVRELLQSVRAEKLEIVILREQIEELKMSLLPGAIRYDKDKVQTSPDDQMSVVMEKVDDYERKLKHRLLSLLDKQSQASELIMELDDSLQRQVLQLYYLDKDRLYWDDIATMMGYTKRRLYQIHGEAIEKLETLHPISPKEVIQ